MLFIVDFIKNFNLLYLRIINIFDLISKITRLKCLFISKSHDKKKRAIENSFHCSFIHLIYFIFI